MGVRRVNESCKSDGVGERTDTGFRGLFFFWAVSPLPLAHLDWARAWLHQTQFLWGRMQRKGGRSAYAALSLIRQSNFRDYWRLAFDTGLRAGCRRCWSCWDLSLSWPSLHRGPRHEWIVAFNTSLDHAESDPPAIDLSSNEEREAQLMLAIVFGIVAVVSDTVPTLTDEVMSHPFEAR